MSSARVQPDSFGFGLVQGGLLACQGTLNPGGVSVGIAFVWTDAAGRREFSVFAEKKNACPDRRIAGFGRCLL